MHCVKMNVQRAITMMSMYILCAMAAVLPIALKCITIPHVNLPNGFTALQTDVVVSGKCKKCA
jgi:hypothetical protein